MCCRSESRQVKTGPQGLQERNCCGGHVEAADGTGQDHGELDMRRTHGTHKLLLGSGSAAHAGNLGSVAGERGAELGNVAHGAGQGAERVAAEHLGDGIARQVEEGIAALEELGNGLLAAVGEGKAAHEAAEGAKTAKVGLALGGGGGGERGRGGEEDGEEAEVLHFESGCACKRREVGKNG